VGAFDGLNPVFAQNIQAMIAASGGLIGPGSGKRSVEEQIALRKSNGCPDVWSSPASSCRVPTAIPGRSNHNHGLAMDVKDMSTGRAVQAGSAADQWLAANAARFGFHRPVKGEAWHVELVDGAEAEAAGPPGPDGEPIRVNLDWMNETRKPEDELSYRLDSIMNMLTQKPPEADTPEQMVQQGDLAQDVTLLAGGDPSTRQTQVSGGAPSAPTGGGGDLKGMVRQMAAQMGWGDDQWGALETLVEKESSWNPTAQNPTSTAFGLFQFLDSTWAGVGASKTSDPAAQTQAGLQYIKNRYGSPQAALNFHLQNNWY